MRALKFSPIALPGLWEPGVLFRTIFLPALLFAYLGGQAQIPASEYSNENRTRNSTTDWKPIPISIERSDNYATGQKSVIRSLAVHPNDPNTVLAAGVFGGIWKSTNKGVSWSPDLAFNLPFIGKVNHVEYSDSDPNHVYAATDVGIIRSTDGGGSWHFTSVNYCGLFPNVSYGGDGYRWEYQWLDVSPTDPKHIVATVCSPNGRDSKIARSNDGGNTWVETSFGVDHFVFSLKFHPANPQIVYALVKNGGKVEYYRSADGGSTFTQPGGFPDYPNPGNQEIRAVLATTPANPDLLIYYLNVNDAGTGIFKSTDAGLSFSKACCGGSSPLINKANGKRDLFGENFSAVQIRWATTFAISRSDPNFMAAATNIPPRFSFDGAATWYWTPDKKDFTGSNIPENVVLPTQLTTYMHGDIQCMVIRGNDVWVANDGGIALSQDKGQTYREVADGIPADIVLGFDNTPGPRDVMAIALDHNGVIVRDESVYGNKWKPMGGGDASGASLNPIDDYWIYGRPSGNHIWQRPKTLRHPHPTYQNTTVAFGNGYLGQFNNVIVHPNQYYTLYAIDYGNPLKAVTSTDNGTTWSVLKTLSPNNYYSYAEIKVSESNPNVMFISENQGAKSQLWKSVNGGKDWTEVNLGSFAGIQNSLGIRNVEISSTDPNTLWLSLDRHQSNEKVIRSTDGGNTWHSYSTGLPIYRILSMLHQRGTNQGVYVGTSYGVYYRNASGSSWTKVGTNLPAVDARFLKINYARNLIRVGTPRGVWEHQLQENSSSQALITSNTRQVDQNNTVIKFASNSVLSANNPTYQWSFPGGSPSSSTEERPQVSYANQRSGSYCAVLTVSDASGKKSTHSLENFVQVNQAPSMEVLFTNLETNRYLFGSGDIYCGNDGTEGGWTGSPVMVGSDATYYGRASWYLTKVNEGAFLIRNAHTHRLLLSTGDKFTGTRGSEGGWAQSPAVVGADANYYNRAVWHIEENPDGTFFLRNEGTNRYLLSTGTAFTGNRGDEGGWTQSPPVVGADENYYNRAKWRISGPGLALVKP